MKNSWNTKKTRTMLLCALLGIFGIHKFYQGKKGQGIMFILLDLTVIGFLITAIWSFINLIQLTINEENTDKEFAIGIILIILGIGGSIGSTRFINININKEKQHNHKKSQKHNNHKKSQTHITKTKNIKNNKN